MQYLAIALKPVAMLVCARALSRGVPAAVASAGGQAPKALLYLDCDMELVSYPSLFEHGGLARAAEERLAAIRAA
jgi:hypothetical protein